VEADAAVPWTEQIKIRKKADLPDNFIKYVQFLEKELQVPVTWVSVGPDRKQIIRLD